MSSQHYFICLFLFHVDNGLCSRWNYCSVNTHTKIAQTKTQLRVFFFQRMQCVAKCLLWCHFTFLIYFRIQKQSSKVFIIVKIIKHICIYIYTRFPLCICGTTTHTARYNCFHGWTKQNRRKINYQLIGKRIEVPYLGTDFIITEMPDGYNRS